MGKVVSPLRAQKCPKKKYKTGAAATNATNASDQSTCAMTSQTSFSAEPRMSTVTDSPDCSFMVSLRVCIFQIGLKGWSLGLEPSRLVRMVGSLRNYCLADRLLDAEMGAATPAF